LPEDRDRVIRIASQTPLRSALVTLGGSSVSILLATLQAIVVLPMLATSVESRMLGGFLAANELLAWLQSTDCGLPNLLIQRISRMRGSAAQRRAHEHFSLCMYFLVLTSAVIGFIIYLFSDSIMRTVGVTGDGSTTVQSAIRLTLAAGLLNVVLNGPLAYARALNRTGSVSMFLVAGSSASLVASTVLASCGGGVWAMAAAGAIRTLLVLVGCSLFLFGHIRQSSLHILANPRKAQLMYYVRRLPAAGISLASQAVLNNCDGLLVAFTLGPGAVAPVVFTKKLMDLCRLFLDQITTASYAPFSRIAQQSNREDAYRFLALEFQVIVFCGAFCAYWFNILGPSVLVAWVGQDMSSGPVFIALYGLAATAQSTNNLAGMMVRAVGDIQRFSRLLLLELLMKLFLALPLLLYLGDIAIPIAGIASSICSLAISTMILGERINVPLSAFMSVVLSKGVLIILLGVGIANLLNWSDVNVKIMIGASASCVVFYSLSKHCANIVETFRQFHFR
jgi:O-antigen/teichoic acid export membrane protein